MRGFLEHLASLALLSLALAPPVPAHAEDCDEDGLSDEEEAQLGTEPCLEDTDGDRALDGEEVTLGTDPLDEDTDGDGLHDGREPNWNQVMAGGDGSICALTPDCDGDGILDPDEGGFDGGSSPGCRDLQPGDLVDTINTFAGEVWSLGIGGCVGSLGMATCASITYYPTVEGLFFRVSRGKEVYWPVDWAKAGYGDFVGVMHPRDPAWLHTDELADMTSFEIGYSAAFVLGVGLTLYVRNDGTDDEELWVPARAHQLSVGVSTSLGAMGLPFSFPISFSAPSESDFSASAGFFLEAPYDSGTCEDLLASQDQERGEGLQPMLDAMRGYDSTLEGTGAWLQEEAMATLADLFEEIAHEEGRGPEDGVPARSNGDLLADFAAREGNAVLSAGEAPDTSLDAFLTRAFDELAELAFDPEFDDAAIASAVTVIGGDLEWVMPDLSGLGAPIRSVPTVTGALDAAATLAEEAEQWPDEPDPLVVEVSGAVDDEIPITVSVDELLVRYPDIPSEVLEGADVVFESYPVIEPTAFPVEDGEVAVTLTRSTAGTILLKAWLDPTSLAEPLPGDLADRELIFDYRLATTESGPATQVQLQVPPWIEEGAELRATAIVADAHGTRVGEPVHDVEFTGPRGELLTSEPIPTVGGAAGLRVLATATIPEITDVYAATLILEDGEEIPGAVLEGTGISRDACLLDDGVPFADAGALYAVKSPEQVLIALDGWAPLDGIWEIVVENPGDIASEPYLHDFDGE